jgi:hypothetical protein
MNGILSGLRRAVRQADLAKIAFITQRNGANLAHAEELRNDVQKRMP